MNLIPVPEHRKRKQFRLHVGILISARSEMNNIRNACRYVQATQIIRIGNTDIKVWVDDGELFVIEAGTWLRGSETSYQYMTMYLRKIIRYK
jgi:hypothetical protein